MRHLATSLGVTTGMLYHYFPNKPALFEAMLRHLAEDNVVQAIGQLEESMSLSRRISVVQAFIENQADHIRQVVWVTIDYQRTTGEEATPLIAEVLGVYKSALAAQLTDGNMDRAEALFSYILGVLVLSGLHPKPGPLFSNLGAVLHAVQ